MEEPFQKLLRLFVHIQFLSISPNQFQTSYPIQTIASEATQRCASAAAHTTSNLSKSRAAKQCYSRSAACACSGAADFRWNAKRSPSHHQQPATQAAFFHQHVIHLSCHAKRRNLAHDQLLLQSQEPNQPTDLAHNLLSLLRRHNVSILVLDYVSLQSRRTLGITRPPLPVMMRAALLRVGCMPLLCCSSLLRHAERDLFLLSCVSADSECHLLA